MAKSVIDDVSDTALWVATFREMETQRPDALFQDPLAGRLVGERGKIIAEKMSGFKYVSWAVVIRTCIIDSYIQELVTLGVDTVVNLGCGLDTRPYRMKLPANLRWIEVDFPRIIKLKEDSLSDQKPNCRLERMAIDLTSDELRKNLFAKIAAESSKILVLTEGVVPYLSLEEVSSLAQALRVHKNFNYWIVDYYTRQVMQHMTQGKRKQEMQNAPFRFDPVDWFGFFKENGWHKREIRYFAEESAKLGRAIPMPLWAKILLSIFRSQNHRAYSQYSGFVVLEPVQ